MLNLLTGDAPRLTVAVGTFVVLIDHHPLVPTELLAPTEFLETVTGVLLHEPTLTGVQSTRFLQHAARDPPFAQIM